MSSGKKWLVSLIQITGGQFFVCIVTFFLGIAMAGIGSHTYLSTWIITAKKCP